MLVLGVGCLHAKCVPGHACVMLWWVHLQAKPFSVCTLKSTFDVYACTEKSVHCCVPWWPLVEEENNGIVFALLCVYMQLVAGADWRVVILPLGFPWVRWHICSVSPVLYKHPMQTEMLCFCSHLLAPYRTRMMNSCMLPSPPFLK